VCVEATSETVHSTDGEHQILVFVVSDAGDSERVRFERHSRNPWKSEKNVLPWRPPDTTIGEGEPDSIVSDIFRDRSDWDKFPGIDKKEFEPSKSMIRDPDCTRRPNGFRFTREE